MASIRSRGSSHQVLWREGGRQTSQTFEDAQVAAAFRAILEAEGSEAAYRWLAQRGMIQGDGGTAPTLDEWVLETYIPGLTDITDGTRSDYRRIYELRWSEPLGKLPVDDASLKRSRITALINAQKAELSPKTISNGHGLLSAALQAAVEDPDIPLGSNPCRGIRLPSGENSEDDAHEMMCLTRDQFTALHHQLPERHRPLITLLYGTGLRWGEATALQARDLDLAGSMLHIRRAWKRGPAGKPTLGAPKHNSRRSLVLGQVLPDVVRPFVAGKAPTDFVFTTSTGGTPIANRSYHEKVWSPALWRLWRCEDHWDAPNPCGCVFRKPSRCVEHRSAPVPCGCEGTIPLDPRIHDLRHTHASQLIAARIPLLAVSRRLGHRSISITVDVYGHLMQESQDEISAAISDSLRDVG